MEHTLSEIIEMCTSDLTDYIMDLHNIELQFAIVGNTNDYKAFEGLPERYRYKEVKNTLMQMPDDELENILKSYLDLE